MTPWLDHRTLSEAIAATSWGPVQVVAATASTNADVAALARSGAPHGTVVATGWQQAGRGRFDRVWTTPPDTCLALSVLTRPTRPLASWGWLAMVVGLAVADGLSEAGVDARLKWPNDVLIGGSKVCGILCEAVQVDDGMAAVLGVGINVALTEAQLPVPTATSLALEGSSATPAEVAGAVLGALDAWYSRWDAGESLTDAYRMRCSTLGRRVRVLLPARIVEGVATDVDADGALLVRTPSGTEAFSAGDVVHLRPGE